jgi:transposase
MVFVEDLNLKGMSRGMLRKHTLDAAFGQFLNLLEWVAKKHQIYFCRVNPDGTSQTCPSSATRIRVKKSFPNEFINVVSADIKPIEITQHPKLLGCVV